jgi:Family of unknown function (DUF6518)
MWGAAYASWPSGLSTAIAGARRLVGAMPASQRDSPPVPSRVPLLALGAALGLGFAGRVAVHAADRLPHGELLVPTGRAAVALGGPWLAAAWAIGALMRSRRRGALFAGAALGVGTAAWYVLTVVADGRAALAYALPVAAAWMPVALGAGALFGFAGAAWSDGTPRVRAASLAALAGALAGEALLLAGQWSGRAAERVLIVEFATAIGLLLLARRRTSLPLALAVFAFAALACAGAEDGVRHILGLVGWNGPTLGR